jgi:hypothetical protein
MDYEGEWGGGGPGHSWALKRHERSECHLGPVPILARLAARCRHQRTLQPVWPRYACIPKQGQSIHQGGQRYRPHLHRCRPRVHAARLCLTGRCRWLHRQANASPHGRLLQPLLQVRNNGPCCLVLPGRPPRRRRRRRRRGCHGRTLLQPGPPPQATAAASLRKWVTATPPTAEEEAHAAAALPATADSDAPAAGSATPSLVLQVSGFLTRPPCRWDNVRSSRPPSATPPLPCLCCRPSPPSPPPPCSLQSPGTLTLTGLLLRI